jgi:hypothetical protein
MHKHRNSLQLVVSVIGIAAMLAFIFALAPVQAAVDTNPNVGLGNVLQVTPGAPGDDPILDPDPDIVIVPETGQQQETTFPSWVIWLVLIIAVIALVAALAGRGRTTIVHHDDDV